MPLVEGGNLRGVLCLADDQPKGFSEETERTMMLVVPQIANALVTLGLYEGVRNSEIKYRTLVESMHDVVFICDRSWKIENADNFPTLHKVKAEGFVQEPFELHKLAQLIRDVLDGVAA